MGTLNARMDYSNQSLCLSLSWMDKFINPMVSGWETLRWYWSRQMLQALQRNSLGLDIINRPHYSPSIYSYKCHLTLALYQVASSGWLVHLHWDVQLVGGHFLSEQQSIFHKHILYSHRVWKLHLGLLLWLNAQHLLYVSSDALRHVLQRPCGLPETVDNARGYAKNWLFHNYHYSNVCLCHMPWFDVTTALTPETVEKR